MNTLRQRFLDKVSPEPNSGCWLWTAATTRAGYGVIGEGHRRVLLAHRVSYEMFVGPIPAGLYIDHKCRIPCCVNPAHLEPVTNRENVRRGHGRVARKMAQTHCWRGHPLAGSNLRHTRKGHRRCAECNRLQCAKYQAKLRVSR